MVRNSGDSQIDGSRGPSWAERERANEKKSQSWAERERANEKKGQLWARGGRNERRSDAAADLRGAEENAAGGGLTGGGLAGGDGSSSKSGLLKVASNEEKAGGLFTGVGKGKKDKKDKKKKGILKRKGPMGLILGLILGVGGVMGGSQFLQPFSLVAQFQETFNSMHTSTKTRSNSFLRYQMNSGRVKSPTKAKIFGGEKFTITRSQKKKLAKQGIEYDKDYVGADGKKARVLKFDDGTGNVKIIAADASAAKKIGNGAVSFDEMYESNPDFYNGYNKGSMTWRGAISNWFGTVTVKLLQSNRITRNLFKDFQERVKAANDGNTKTVALKLMAEGADEITEGGYESNKVQKETTEVDENGNPVTVVETEDDFGDITPGNSDKPFDDTSGDGQVKYTTDSSDEGTSGGGKTNRSDLKTDDGVKAKLNGIAGAIKKGANIACSALNFMGGVSMLVTASEALQIINLVTGYFEAIDKTKAGSSDSPINDLMGALNERKSTAHTTVVDSGEVWDESRQDQIVTSDGISTLKTKEVSSDKSAMESSGIVALYSGEAVNPEDPSVQSFNFTSSINRVLGGIGTSVSLFEACAIAKIGANIASAVIDGIEIAGCVLGLLGAAFTFGISAAGCSGLVIGMAKGAALSVAIGVVISGIISTITPMVSKMLMRDLIADIGGEDLGNALTSGANMYMGNTHRANGGSLADRDTYIAYVVEQRKVIADDARYERQTKSPFDATSKNTFFGVLANNLMRLASTTSVMSTLTSVGSTVSSSIVALSPTAMAYDVSKTLPTPEEYEETCPYLASIGAVGDAYCNPYSVTDMSTINMDPADVVDAVSDNLLDESEDGNARIDPHSDLAKYIIYCDNRSSSFGIADQNIANQVGNWGNVETNIQTVDTMANAAIGAIPVLGDIIDIAGDQSRLDNLGYISGESCVAGNTVDKAESPNWDKAKYYQRFIEDQSLGETIGLFGEDGESAVSVFLDEYYEKNPLDNSYEGILARYSGLQKETVVAVLDFIDYSNYIAEYDASERYEFGGTVVEEEDKDVMFESEDVMAGEYVLMNNIVYADVRNRVALV